MPRFPPFARSPEISLEGVLYFPQLNHYPSNGTAVLQRAKLLEQWVWWSLSTLSQVRDGPKFNFHQLLSVHRTEDCGAFTLCALGSRCIPRQMRGRAIWVGNDQGFVDCSSRCVKER